MACFHWDQTCETPEALCDMSCSWQVHFGQPPLFEPHHPLCSLWLYVSWGFKVFKSMYFLAHYYSNQLGIYVCSCIHTHIIHEMVEIQRDQRWWGIVYSKNEQYHADFTKKHTSALLFYLSSCIYHVWVQVLIFYLHSPWILLKSCSMLRQWIFTEINPLDYRIFQLSMLWLLILIQT